MGAWATPTSSTVSNARTPKMTKYSLRLTLCPPDMPPRSSGCGDEVNEGEDQDPDQVDEVPEETDDLDLARAPAVVFPAQGVDEDDGQVANAGEHVAAVEAGHHVEGARVGRVPEDEPLFDEA